jgi:hypothetical protein
MYKAILRLTGLYMLRRPVRAARLRKTPVGLTPFVVFCVATVWAGVVAPQRPITCPNRQLQP